MKNIVENLVNILKAKSKRGILKYKKDGFSLIEVVIAITLMAILSGIAMTSYTKVQQEEYGLYDCGKYCYSSTTSWCRWKGS